MSRHRIYRALAVSSAFVIVFASMAVAAGEKFVVYGADTTQAERQELAQFFGVDASAKTDIVTTPEMVAALQGSNLPVSPTDKSISSSALTCLNKGDGLTVRTENITRLTAPVYANALVTAGVGDAGVIIAAPASNPVTGETALVGVLKAFPQCQAGKQPDAIRVRYAYAQIGWTAFLAGQGGDLNKAGTAMLQAEQPVITGQAKDDTAIGAALDSAAAGQGLTVDPAQRPQMVTFLKGLGSLDYGAYAKGYQIQQVSQTQVKVVPAGAAAPGSATATPVAASAATPAANATAQPAVAATPANAFLPTITGVVQTAGAPLLVRTGGQDRQVNPSANTIVTRDGKDAKFSDIRKGDMVTVATAPDGTVVRIDAKSNAGGGNDWLKWLIPLLLLLGLLGLLALLLARRRRDSFILEPNKVGGLPPRGNGRSRTRQ